MVERLLDLWDQGVWGEIMPPKKKINEEAMIP